MGGPGVSGGRLGAGGEHAVEARLPILAIGIVLVFVVFVGRLFQLQITEGADLRERSQRNSVRTVYLEAPRGDVLDREGRVLATTRPAFGLQVLPVDLTSAEQTFAALGQLLERDAVEMHERVGAPKGRERFQPVRLVSDLDYDRLASVESHLFALPGVVTDIRPRRDYVHRDLAAHWMGYIGEVRRDQLASPEYTGYRQGEVVGQSGVEKLLQSELRGRAGGRNLVVDVGGRTIEVMDEVHPVPGGAVTLTLDLDLQRVAEEAFLPDVLGGEPRVGALAAFDPRNGDVLALVSKPSFDPNDFAGGIDGEKWQELLDDPWRPLQNRAISGQYPPGSTYKAIVAAAALELDVVDPAETIYCPGHFRLGRRTYRCWRRGGHGDVDLHTAIVRSCDVYFYQIGLRLGIDRLAEYSRRFGFGNRSRIALAHERPGLVPTSEWKERRFGEVWVRGETVSAAIGQGFNLTTPLQLAVAFGAIANGGMVMKPRIVLSTTDGDGVVRSGPESEIIDRLPIAPEHLARVGAALEGVVSETGGTGGRARISGVRVAGKTGTAQVVGIEHYEGLEDEEIAVRHRDHAWFVAYAPVDAPEIAVAVIVEHGMHGSSAAAPIAAAVLRRHFEKQSQEVAPPPDLPLLPSPGETPGAAAAANDTVTLSPEEAQLARN